MKTLQDTRLFPRTVRIDIDGIEIIGIDAREEYWPAALDEGWITGGWRGSQVQMMNTPLIEETVERAARAVANSPLVKAALNGGDPNWGRIVQAIGGALIGTAPLALDLHIEGTQVCVAGAAIPCDEDTLRVAVQRAEVEYEVTLPGEGAETEVFFSDLSHDYVTINADYTT